MRHTERKGEETEIRRGQKTVSFEKLYGGVMLWRESTKKMVIVGCLLHSSGSRRFISKYHLVALIGYSQPPLGVTCPIFSDSAFYVEAGIHPGIAAVELESFDGDDSAEAAILPQLKKEHKGESPFSQGFENCS